MWASPYRGVPRILLKAIGLRLSLPNLSCTAISPNGSHWPIRVAPFWPIRTVRLGTIILQGFGILICMRTDQSGTSGKGFCLCRSAPLLLQKLKTVSPQLEVKHLEQGYLIGKGPSSRPPHSWAVTLLSCSIAMLPYCMTVELFALNKVSFTASQIEDSCWHRVGSNDHQLTVFKFLIYLILLSLWFIPSFSLCALCFGSFSLYFYMYRFPKPKGFSPAFGNHI